MAIIGSDIKFAIELLNQNELVGIPTETVYGLAANAFDVDAVAKIFKVKERPTFDPLIVHTSSLNRISDFVQEIPDEAIKLANRFWPGPLTMIFKKKSNIPDLVTAGLETVAVRIPNHKLILNLLDAISFPLAAPSANPFGYVSPTSAKHVNEQLGSKINYILDGGACQVGIESTIVEFNDDGITILRLGGCEVEEIEKVVGRVNLKSYSSSNPKAPGMMQRHYSPLTPIAVGDIDNIIAQNPDKKIGVLAFNKKAENINGDHQYVLTNNDDIDEAATRLFTGIRYLDKLNLQLIACEFVPNVGLGRAINDRLKRAGSKRN